MKLSEREFGSAVDDHRHRSKRREIYLPRLEGCVDPALLEPEAFFANCQLLRNLWQITADARARVLFLVPRVNTTVYAQAEAFRLRVTEPLRERVAVRAIEDVLTALVDDDECPDVLRAHAAAMRLKYVP